MNSFVVTAAAVAKYQRMDAPFHQAIQGAQKLITTLQANGITPERAKEKLASVPARYLTALTPLLTSDEQATEAGLRVAGDRYPVEALALVLNVIDESISEIEAKKQELNRQDLDDLPTNGLPN